MTEETVTMEVERVNNGTFVSGRLKNGYLATAIVTKEDAQRLIRQLAQQGQGDDGLRSLEVEIGVDQLVAIERSK